MAACQRFIPDSPAGYFAHKRYDEDACGRCQRAMAKHLISKAEATPKAEPAPVARKRPPTPRSQYTTVPATRHHKTRLSPGQKEVLDEVAGRAAKRARGEAYEYTDRFGVVIRWAPDTPAEIEERLEAARARRGETTGALSYGVVRGGQYTKW